MPAFETFNFTVGQLFTRPRVYLFPEYQRPYRWRTDQAGQLLDDLMQAMGEGSADSPPYFIGSIVTVRQAGERHLVIDGRQRLTTLAILIGALRDLESDENKASVHQLLFDEGAAAINVERGYRLRMDDAFGDSAAYEQFAGAIGSTRARHESIEDIADRHFRIAEAAELFSRRLGSWPTPRRAALLHYLLNKCELVAVTAADESSGLRVFQVLNTRGLPLSQTDLTKPLLLKRLPAEEREAASAAWEHAESMLGERGMEDLFRSLHFVFTRNPANPEFYRDIDATIARRGAKTFLERDLVPYSEALDQILRRSIPYDDPTQNPNTLIQALTWLPWDASTTWGPVALQALAKHNDDARQQYRLLWLLDRLCYTMLIRRVDQSAHAQILGNFLSDINEGQDPGRTGAAGWLTDDGKRTVRDNLLKPFHFAPERGAILRRIELALAPQNIHPHIDDATVEHIMPQRPNRQSEWAKRFSFEDRQKVSNKLGNLILLNRGINYLVGDSWFTKKKQQMFRHTTHRHLNTASELRDYSDWNPAIIEQRTEKFANVLLECWGLR